MLQVSKKSQKLNLNKMLEKRILKAYQLFAINFTLIQQIVYEIITNQFTPISVAALLTHF